MTSKSLGVPLTLTLHSRFDDQHSKKGTKKTYEELLEL